MEQPNKHLPPKQRPFRDERDEQIHTASKSYAGEIMVTLAEVLMIVCLIKGNPAWRGFLSVALGGCAAMLLRAWRDYRESPWFCAGLFMAIAALTLAGWFLLS